MRHAHTGDDRRIPQDDRCVREVVEQPHSCADGLTRRRDSQIRNEEVDVEFALVARLRDAQTFEVNDEVELAPNGEGFGMGYAMWRDGEFGTTPPWEALH
jgi:hypothetical protein